MEAEVLSLVGVSQIQDTIDTVRKSFNPNLKVLGILLNKYDRRLTLSREILDLAESVAEQLEGRREDLEKQGSPSRITCHCRSDE